MAPWHDEASLEKHRKDVAHILAKDVHADVICILEATSKPALEKLTDEPELRPLHYRVYHVESRDDATGQDAAFLARIPLDRIAGGYIHDFPQEGSDPLTKRAVIYLTAGKLRLGLLGLHLLAHPDDPYRNRKREAQTRIATRLIRNEIVARGYTPVVLGDLNDYDPDVLDASNDVPQSRALYFLKHFDKKDSKEDLFNAAESIPASERYSDYRDLNRNGKWDAGEPVSMIDHILLDRSLSSGLLDVKILHGAQPDGSVSDHWPVVVELKR